jgi:hypothetical protein
MGMNAVLMLASSRLRRRWRAWVALAVLLGVAGGVVLTAAAGARRTDSAYPRYLEWSRADDLLVSLGDSLVPRIEALPQVDLAAFGIGYALYRVDAQGHLSADPQRAIGTTDDRALRSFDRPVVVAGRLADPDRADEATVNPALARLWHLHPGSRVTLRAFSPADQAAVGDASRPVPATVGHNRTFTVTGIVVGADDVIADPRQEITRFDLTPAYSRLHRAAEENYSGVFVRLRHGQADLAAFEAAVNRIAAGAAAASGEGGPGGLPALVNPRFEVTARVQHAMQPEVVALWLFAALVAVCTLLVAGQAVTRQLTLEGDDGTTLRALGMTPAQLTVAALAQVGLLALAGAVLAAAAAVAASPLMPVGPVAVVEPHPGLSVDWLVLGAGMAAMVVLLLLRSLQPAWQLARGSRAVGGSAATVRTGGVASGQSRLGAALAAAGLPASTAVGIRMALEPGRGRTAVPVRSSIAGTALAVMAVVAALTFASSLRTLVDTPRLYGWNWDLQVDNGFDTVTRDQLAAGLGRDPDVAAYAGGSYGRVRVDGTEVPAVGLVDLQGSAYPTLAAGRAPAAAGEIVLGSATLSAVHRSLGDTVTVQGDGPAVRMRIVGRAVFPVLGIGDFAPTSLGEGAALTVSGLDAVGGSAIAAFTPPGTSPASDLSFALVRFRPGVDADAATARIQAQVPRQPVGPLLVRVLRPTDIATYQRIQSTPLLLAAMLGLLGVATLAHALVSAVRRRARDLAVLKTLGFVRRQVWSAVAWQATTMVSVALLVGVPAGVAAGRWAWSLFAGQVGVVDESVVPLAAVLLVVPAALLLANLLAAMPGRVAARVRPALVLRSE